MKGHACYLMTCLLAGSMMWAQSGQSPSSSPQGEQSPPRQEHPTLGPRTGPGTEAGPLTSTTFDLKKLRRIHNLYIENIDNSLSDKLIEAIGKSGLFRLVTKAKDADAILRGSCLESRRLKDVHSEVFINDRSGASVWQDTIYRPFNPPTLDKAVSETATLVVSHLERSLRGVEPR
jgi:hypothetical protein